jgi:ribose transport system ATP-binding protein
MTGPDPTAVLKQPGILGAQITIDNVSKYFGGNIALSNVSVHIEPGTVHAFVGENGAGKSTLAKIVAGVQAPDGGSFSMDGEAMSFAGPHEAKALGIAMVHQEISTLPSLSVAENVLFGREPSRAGFIQRKQLQRESVQYLNMVGLKVSPNEQAGQLSTPQQQLLEIAHALASQARVIILDEPSSSLATKDARHLMELVRKLRAAGQTVILVSHDFDEVCDIADTVTCLRDGELVTTCPASEVDHDKLVRLVTGRDIDLSVRHEPQGKGEPILSVQGLTATGVSNATLDVRPGEIVGIGGLVGSGRTELLMAIMGDNAVVEGRMWVEGAQFAPRSPYAAMARGVSLVPESRKEQGLVLTATVRENIELAALDAINGGLFASTGKASKLASKYIKELRIKVADDDVPVESLSGGNQQKVVIAKALATQPKILLLDEPTKGIDIGAKEEILSLIRGLSKAGLAVVMVSSVIPELLTSCDRVLVMRGGRIVGDLVTADTTEDEIARLAFAG